MTSNRCAALIHEPIQLSVPFDRFVSCVFSMFVEFRFFVNSPATVLRRSLAHINRDEIELVQVMVLCGERWKVWGAERLLTRQGFSLTPDKISYLQKRPLATHIGSAIRLR